MLDISLWKFLQHIEPIGCPIMENGSLPDNVSLAPHCFPPSSRWASSWLGRLAGPKRQAHAPLKSGRAASHGRRGRPAWGRPGLASLRFRSSSVVVVFRSDGHTVSTSVDSERRSLESRNRKAVSNCSRRNSRGGRREISS